MLGRGRGHHHGRGFGPGPGPVLFGHRGPPPPLFGPPLAGPGWGPHHHHHHHGPSPVLVGGAMLAAGAAGYYAGSSQQPKTTVVVVDNHSSAPVSTYSQPGTSYGEIRDQRLPTAQVSTSTNYPPSTATCVQANTAPNQFPYASAVAAVQCQEVAVLEYKPGDPMKKYMLTVPEDYQYGQIMRVNLEGGVMSVIIPEHVARGETIFLIAPIMATAVPVTSV